MHEIDGRGRIRAHETGNRWVERSDPAQATTFGNLVKNALSTGGFISVAACESSGPNDVFIKALHTASGVITIGSPKGLPHTLGSGLLSGLRKLEGEADYIQTTAPVSEGSSGGGLFDDRGNLIGVTTFTVRDSQNLNFAIAASAFWREARTEAKAH